MNPAIFLAIAVITAGGRGAAEHLCQRGGRPVPRQELPVPQVRRDGGGPRPVLHRGVHSVRRLRLSALPAARARHPRGQVSDLRLQVRYLRLHLADPRIPLSQQLSQPRVRSAQPSVHLANLSQLAGHRGRTGHTVHYTRAGPQ
jgi:hypothetical protein